MSNYCALFLNMLYKIIMVSINYIKVSLIHKCTLCLFFDKSFDTRNYLKLPTTENTHKSHLQQIPSSLFPLNCSLIVKCHFVDDINRCGSTSTTVPTTRIRGEKRKQIQWRALSLTQVIDIFYVWRQAGYTISRMPPRQSRRLLQRHLSSFTLLFAILATFSHSSLICLDSIDSIHQFSAWWHVFSRVVGRSVFKLPFTENCDK